MHKSLALAFDVAKIRQDFPILQSKVWCKDLVYLDNAATSQKPSLVIEAVERFYKEANSNVHRGVHYLSAQATRAYEEARDKVAAFLNARDREIIFTRGTTEAINLVARSFVRPRIQRGDEILITHMEHHSNIVPWQLLCEETGAVLKVAPVNEAGELRVEEFTRLLSDRTRLVGVVHVSNSLGTINPVETLVAEAHARGVPVLIDGAQAVPHLKVDLRALDCDFYAFSGHKAFGPTGIGVLYGKRELLEAMPPYQGGGEMIRAVTFAKTTFNDVPHKFEAGTPNIAGAIGLGTAVDYLGGLDMTAVHAHEQDLLAYGTEALRTIPGLRLIGTARHKAAVISFVMDGVHPHDIGTILDHEGVAVRTGHHCTMPLMELYGVPATTRASFALYNTRAEIDLLVEGLQRVRDLFGR
ncbi:MAG: SufS family cysteine desulfurase [Planctomycetota bacterium]|jgi:cysteine desulfurase/selenocysteine lyase